MEFLDLFLEVSAVLRCMHGPGQVLEQRPLVLCDRRFCLPSQRACCHADEPGVRQQRRFRHVNWLKRGTDTQPQHRRLLNASLFLLVLPACLATTCPAELERRDTVGLENKCRHRWALFSHACYNFKDPLRYAIPALNPSWMPSLYIYLSSGHASGIMC
eukprot:COSAG05_NODE_277_length_12336_cov_419.763668_10_plen_159_part_00